MKSILKLIVFLLQSSLYIVISQSETNHTLVDVAYYNSMILLSLYYKSIDQPIVEWIPSVLSAGYQYTDQLVLWLITIINISFFLFIF